MPLGAQLGLRAKAAPKTLEARRVLRAGMVIAKQQLNNDAQVSS